MEETAGGTAVVQGSYPLPSAGREQAEDERLRLLERVFDPASQRRRSIVRPGWRCLDIGGGRGSIAAWLAGQVGPTGHVVVTDLETSLLERLDLPNLEVRRHDILNDPLEDLAGSFDLVCSRHVLTWVTGRQPEAVARMAACLRPGGWLLAEDGDWAVTGPTDPAHPAYAPYHAAYRAGGYWTERGLDAAVFGRRLPSLFDAAGLLEIRHECAAQSGRGGDEFARWFGLSLAQIRLLEETRGTLTAARAQEYEALLPPWHDPGVWLVGGLVHACWGRRPASARAGLAI